jgi:signal transduction histidine kinase
MTHPGWRPGQRRRWDGSHGWPPHGPGDWANRRRFFRRLTAIAFVVVALGLWGLFMLLWSTAARLGVVDASGPGIPFFLVAAWFAGFALITFFRVGRGISRPLRAVMDAADRVAGGDYTARVGVHGPPPVRALAHAFNTMTERLEKHDQQRRDLMADVAHELRTPLTVIQGRVEGLLDGVYPRDDAGLEIVLGETRVLSRLIDDLRTLALSEAGALKLETETTDIAALARDVAAALSGEAAAKQITIQVRDDDHPAIAVDPVRIREVLTNLVSNALRHSTVGGTVTIAIAPSTRSGQAPSAGSGQAPSAGSGQAPSAGSGQASGANGVAVSVADTGAGMTPEEAQRAFARFYKSAGSGGSGLGLAIARGIVLAHGGSIDIASEPGRGTTITFTLPPGNTTPPP